MAAPRALAYTARPRRDAIRPSALPVRREAMFVATGLAGMVGGLAAELAGGPALAVWLGYGIAYGFGGFFGLRAGLDALRHARVDIDLLMILAALGALVIGAPFEGAMLLFLFALSNVLQHVAIGRSRASIQSLMTLRPETAQVRRGTGIEEVPVQAVAPGTVYVVRPGDRLPLDGVVIAGESEVDQASLTGESVPVLRSPGDPVYGGTINGSGALDVRVTKRAGESAIARLIALVEEAQGQKAAFQRLIDRLEQPYVLGVLLLTTLAVVVPTLGAGEPFRPVFYRAMTLLVAASPCALVISTPAAILSAIAAGARRGVLFKGGIYLEQLAAVRAVAFDKTGTLTEGKTHLAEIVAFGGASESEVLELSASVQAGSEHHLAHATVTAAQGRGLGLQPTLGFQATIGEGVRARIGEATILVGNRRYFANRKVEGWPEAEAALARAEAEGRTAVVVARQEGGRCCALGVTAFADGVRSEARGAVARLRRLGVEHIALITGDHATVAAQVAAKVDVDAVHAEALPERKVAFVRALRATYGDVAFVGDGVNDGPALAAASVGVAMGGVGTDVALETADLVLMADDLAGLPLALELSRRARRTLVQNLSLALGMIGLMIGFILTVGLPLPLAVVGHEGSTVLVALNGLRLLGFQSGEAAGL